MCGLSACVLLAATGASGCGGGVETAGLPPYDEELNDGAKPLAACLKASLDLITHRGPDDMGIWVSPNEQVGLAHCRLSINDLSSAGRHPLHSSDDKIHAVVNGEIYDYDGLRRECETVHGYPFQSESEFAFVLYDNSEAAQRVIAARDRYGIKPLVYTQVGSKLRIASEAKAFLPLGWKLRWDVRAIADAGWTFDDRTLFRGVRKVLPGHYLDITEQGGVQQVEYWDAQYEDKLARGWWSLFVFAYGLMSPLASTYPGGIDSSAIASIVTELARKEKVKIGNEGASSVTCFTIAFPETSGFDESLKIVKKFITEDTLAEDFADAVFHCEHHHFDLNFVAKFGLSTLLHEHSIKVVLTGEGADEHFAGYPHLFAKVLREADGALPNPPMSQDSDLRKNMLKDMKGE
ncbi:hypothetical protein GQX73_g5508 [Xylaria multiplex]|uniref:Glutamine amidotransferase type-2 domain-containing protein n=1 Tax=Xylaria multiplex TaxID=323545 RepID=A0A7C8ISM5_9PEZI|nr:hypothetical protein GQX73_g5508 [Xylaria multiplex]